MKKSTKLKKQIEGYQNTIGRCRISIITYDTILAALYDEANLLSLDLDCYVDLDLSESEVQEKEAVYEEISKIIDQYENDITHFQETIEKYETLIKEAQTELEMLG